MRVARHELQAKGVFSGTRHLRLTLLGGPASVIGPRTAHNVFQ